MDLRPLRRTQVTADPAIFTFLLNIQRNRKAEDKAAEAVQREQENKMATVMDFGTLRDKINVNVTMNVEEDAMTYNKEFPQLTALQLLESTEIGVIQNGQEPLKK